MENKSWISISPRVMGGKACIRDTRVTVDTIISLIAVGYNRDYLLASYPYLNDQDLLAAKAYSVKLVQGAEITELGA